MATEAELVTFLEEHSPARKFVPYCHLSQDSDCLTVYFEDDADYSERINDHLTVYRSLETKEVVGCRIKGMSGIMEDLPNYIRYSAPDVDLSVIFFAFRGGLDAEQSRLLKSLADAATEKQLTLQPV